MSTPRWDVPNLLARLDRAIAELQAIRAAVAEGATGTIVPVDSGLDADDLGDGNLLDTTSAAARFGFPRDTIALWARQTAGTEQAIAVRSGGRWLIDPKKLRQRINGG